MSRIMTLVTSDTRASRVAAAVRDIDALLTLGPVMVTVAEYTPAGTLDQNALFHKLCDHIADWWNLRWPARQTSKDRIKERMKIDFGVKIVEYDPATDGMEARLASWTEYTKRQRSALITNTLAWMAERGIPDLPEIPDSTYAQYREAAA